VVSVRATLAGVLFLNPKNPASDHREDLRAMCSLFAPRAARAQTLRASDARLFLRQTRTDLR
jgi:hypothetical protein